MAVSELTSLDRTPDGILVDKGKRGDAEAIEYLLAKYRSVVLFKSRSYFLHGADRDDMIQEGMIGLFKAIRDFRPDRGAAFRTFADICITRQMITAVKGGSGQGKLLTICATSLDTPAREDVDANRLDIPAPNDTTDPSEILIARATISELRGTLKDILSEFEWNVFVGFAEGKSYGEIAKEHGKRAKSVDNALCRVRRKMAKWSNEEQSRRKKEVLQMAGYDTETIEKKIKPRPEKCSPRPPLPQRTCEQCGNLYNPDHPRRKTCSAECSASRREYSRKTPLEERVCSECSKTFVSRYHKQRTCSRECGRKRQRIWQKQYWAQRRERMRQKNGRKESEDGRKKRAKQNPGA